MTPVTLHHDRIEERDLIPDLLLSVVLVRLGVGAPCGSFGSISFIAKITSESEQLEISLSTVTGCSTLDVSSFRLRPRQHGKRNIVGAGLEMMMIEMDLDSGLGVNL